ncbi:hypothetical protein [Pseudoduganella umbonata]|uniref:Uncharacterized protein n=1 Tax=Pseudoduganella umbonata TaxID=864828 RepID=A0A4P8HPR5_9BURK|nr:hypothetical protein [Pseudoduganella umbonata]MBB3220794.1 hypothetical protein [Pseudoduganella umbonata]QCP11737.1 hypothetical protein FCL38_15890 [Pseudoduganella umbonata]
MAKTNFQYEKRQRELEKKRKAEEKARRKEEAKHRPAGEQEADTEGLETVEGDNAEEDTTALKQE